MNSISLRQLIRESINEYIREIDQAGETAAVEAKITKIGEAITLREKKMNMEGIDEAYHDMIDKGKMKELSSEIKTLKKSLSKYEKQLEKLKNKGEKVVKAEEVEEKEIVDEVSIDEMTNDPESGPQLEEDETNEEISIYEMLYMQKRAGIISEREYNEKIEAVEEAKKMTTAQKDKKEDIVKGMKKSKSFGKSKDEKDKMYATATKLATKK